jgi:hypothetical protein
VVLLRRGVESGEDWDDDLVSRQYLQGLALRKDFGDFDRVSTTSTHDRDAASSWQVSGHRSGLILIYFISLKACDIDFWYKSCEVRFLIVLSELPTQLSSPS